MDAHRFVETVYAPEPQKRKMENWCRKFEDTLRRAGATPATVTLEQLYGLWNKEGHVSKSKFYEMKAFLIRLFSWLQEQGEDTAAMVERLKSVSIDQVVRPDRAARYIFRDETALDGSIRRVGERLGLGGENDLLNIRAAALLWWYGVTARELPDIRKADVDVLKRCVTVPADGRRLLLSPAAMEVVRRYAYTDEVRSFPSGKRQTYVDSEFLFRSGKCDRLNDKNLCDMLRRFNRVAAEDGVQLHVPTLNRNGMFPEVYAWEQELKNKEEAIRQVIPAKNLPSVYAFRFHYEQWKRLFSL